MPGCTGFIEPEVLDEAAKDLRKWCRLIDYGNYLESWDRAAPELRKRVSKISWQEYLISYRQPFGDVISRKVVEAKHTTILKGIGEGAMITLKLRSEYANKTLYEKVIMVLHNGQWQVAAYMFGETNMPRS